jgi:hypothetical protein
MKCSICGYQLQGFGRPPDTDTAADVTCPNCGQYRLQFSLRSILEQTPYSESARNMASYRVFNASYYAQVPKELSKADFDATEELTTPQKLYSLAKYFYTETKRGNKEPAHRPACCAQGNDEGYADLLKNLHEKGLIDYISAEDDGDDYAGMFLDLKATPKCKTFFEGQANSLEAFQQTILGISSMKYPRVKRDALDLVSKMVDLKKDKGTAFDQFLESLGTYRLKQLDPFLKKFDYFSISYNGDGTFRVVGGASFWHFTSNDAQLVINDIENGLFDRYFMGTEASGDTYNITGNTFSGGQNPIGGKNNNNTMLNMQNNVTADLIRQGLKENGVNTAPFDEEIVQIGAECDSGQGNFAKLKAIIAKIPAKIPAAVWAIASPIISAIIQKKLGF